MKNSFTFLLLCLSLVACANEADRWQLLETEHFYIAYEKENVAELQKVGDLAEDIHKRLTAIFPSKLSGKTHIVLSDWNDESNGFAELMPYPKIRIYLPPPQDNSLYGLGQSQWLEYVLTHEYAHILQLGARDGTPASLGKIFGSAILPAAFTPPWAYEGWAVYCESNFVPQSSGRLAEPYFRGILRHDLAENNLRSLTQVSNIVLDWPQSMIYYPYGALFIEYLAAQYGRAKLVEFFQNLLSQPPSLGFVPTFDKTFGIPLQEAYRNWQQQLSSQVGEYALRDGRQLTQTGARTSQPFWDKQGNLYYLAAEVNKPRKLMKYSNGEHTFIALWDDEEEFVLSNQGELFFSRPTWQQDRYYHDLYVSDLNKKRTRRLTENSRASSPTLSADGRQLAFVVLDPPLRHIYLLELATGDTRPLLLADEETSFYSPAWSPAGDRLAVVTQRRGVGRQLEFVDVHTGRREPVTGCYWQESSPSWDPSGRYLLFTAQDEGFINLYAFDLETEKVHLVAKDAGPGTVSPDGTLAYVASTAKGEQIYTLPFKLQGELTPPSVVSEVNITALPAVPSKITDYRAWPSLRPHFWLPMWQDGALGAFTMGEDVLELQKYMFFVGMGPSGRASYSFNYSNSAFGPTFELASQSGVNSFKLTQTWRSVFVPAGTLGLSGLWSDGETELHLSYSTARTYGFMPGPSRGTTCSVAVGLQQRDYTAQLKSYFPLGRGVLAGSLAAVWGEQWAAGSKLQVMWPLASWQQGLLNPPVYLVDSWGKLGFAVTGNREKCG